jgi:thiol-disulfide isomerase/thioredoxin
MSKSFEKPALVFFELIGCPPCKRFRNEELEKLVNDPELKKVVNIFNSVEGQEKKDEVINGKQVTRIITYEIPERFKGKVRWNPFFMLIDGKDHENKVIQEGKYASYGMNEQGRHDGVSSFTSEQLKKWVLSTVNKYNDEQPKESVKQSQKQNETQPSKQSQKQSEKHVRFEDEKEDNEQINNHKSNIGYSTPTPTAGLTMNIKF